MLERGKQDLEWFDNNLENLKSKHNNEFIAFKNCQVIEADSSLDSLMKKLNKKGTDMSSVFIKFVSRIETIL